MYWRLRKKFLQYFRRRQSLQNYDKAVKKVVTYRFVYYFLGWTTLGLAVFHFMFVRTDPKTGKKYVVKPNDVTMWDLNSDQPFEVYEISLKNMFQKSLINPCVEMDDDD